MEFVKKNQWYEMELVLCICVKDEDRLRFMMNNYHESFMKIFYISVGAFIQRGLGCMLEFGLTTKSRTGQ